MTDVHPYSVARPENEGTWEDLYRTAAITALISFAQRTERL